uniref:mRNA n=1 Tax=Oulactis sp. TaxID=2093647 RepID=A0A4U8YUH1_OULSP|nr:mRNA [Oulactis sp. MM-2018]
MANFKEIIGILFVVLYIVATSCGEITKEVTAKEKEREALLEAMMYISETQSHSLHTRVKRGAKRHHRRQRPNWKDHPLYPLYPIDFEACEDAPRESKAGLCAKWEKSGYCKKRKYKWMMKSFCKKTCLMCKARSPVYCEGSKFGCCWDNKAALGPNGEGCLPCFDVYQITCPQFKGYCDRHSRNGRFIRYHCFKTCGRCAM